MEKIQSYELLDNKAISTSSAVYRKTRKNGEYFFLKMFNDPVRPTERIRAHNPVEFKRRDDWCKRFENTRKTVNALISALGGGNFVAPVDFFLHENRYYQATPWREIEKKTIGEIVALGDPDKMLILKTAANCLKLLHEKGIIHCDIKPDNLPVTLTASNKSTCSLIDFDSAVLEGKIPAPDEVYGTDRYWSPELMSYKMGRNYYGDYKFNVKNDVFAAAMVFHYYWSGEDFSYPAPKRGPYLHHAVLEDAPITVSSKVPEWLKTLLLRMIDKDPEKRPTMSEVLECLKQVTLKPTQETSDEAFDNEKTSSEDRPYTEPKEEEDGNFIKGANFPDDAISFEILPNGKVKFTYNDGSKMALSLEVAVKKQYITEK